MVRSLCTGALLVAVAGFGPAWGQQPPRPAAAPVMVTVKENGGDLKCRLVSRWKTASGGRAYQLQVAATGEMLTVVEEAPNASGPARPDKLRALNMKIYHWGASKTPPPGVPVPATKAMATARPPDPYDSRKAPPKLVPQLPTNTAKPLATPYAPIAAAAKPAVATVYENGRDVKCQIVKKWQMANGFHAYQVRVVAGGEMLTVVEDDGTSSADKSRSVRIYHWGRGLARSPAGAPVPPGEPQVVRSPTVVTEIKSDKPVILYESKPILVDLDPAVAMAHDAAVKPAGVEPAVKPAGIQVVQPEPPRAADVKPKPGESVVCDCQPCGPAPRVPAAPLCQCEPAPTQPIDRLLSVPLTSAPGAGLAPQGSPYAPVLAKAPAARAPNTTQHGSSPIASAAPTPGQANPTVIDLPPRGADTVAGAMAVPDQANPGAATVLPRVVDAPPPVAKTPPAAAVVSAPQPAPAPPIAAQAALNKPAGTPTKKRGTQPAQVRQEPARDGLNLGDGPLDWRHLWAKTPASENKQPGQSTVDPVASGTGPSLTKSDLTSPLSGEKKSPPAVLPSPPPVAAVPAPPPAPIEMVKKEVPPAATRPEPPATPIELAKKDPPPTPAPPARKVLPPPPMSVTESSGQPDPLLNPGRFQPPVVEKKMEKQQAVYVPRPSADALPPLPPVPMGSLSVIAAQNGMAAPTQFVPVPVPTVPQPWRPPAPPPPEVPQAPQATAYVNAFTPPRPQAPPPQPQPGGAFTAPPNGAPSMPMAYAPYNYGPPAVDPRLVVYAPLPQQPMYGPNQPYMPAGYAGWQPGYSYPAPGPQPQLTPVGYPMGYQGAVPISTLSQAPAYASPPTPQAYAVMDRQAGYSLPEGSSSTGAISPVNAAVAPGSSTDVARTVRILRDSIYPADREDAAVNLGNLNLRAYPDAIQALIERARQDPAGAVRAACVRCVVQQNLTGEQVTGMLNALKADSDPRVRQELERALPH